MFLPRLNKIGFLTGMLILGFSSLANAYSIGDAIKSARENNTSIKSAREQLKAIKTDKLTAMADFLPSITTDSTFTTTYATEANSRPILNGNNRRNTLTATQPLFTGLSSVYGYDKAKNNAEAARFGYGGIKDSVLLNTVYAYETLLTAREVYKFNVKNQEVFATHLVETQERFNLGESTLTDVSQAKASLADAISSKAQALGDLSNAQAFYEHTVGQSAPTEMDRIRYEEVTIPDNFESFLEIVLQKNPQVLQQKSKTKAAVNDKQLAFSKLSPVVTANAQYLRTNEAKPITSTSYKTDANSYYIDVQFPIFQQGKEYTGIKKARHLEKQANWDLEETKRAINENSVKAWSEYQTKKAIVKSSAESIIASQSALDGVVEEAKVGTRTTLDVLDAEKALFEARIQNKTAVRDYVVSLFAIHQLMGDINMINMLNIDY